MVCKWFLGIRNVIHMWKRKYNDKYHAFALPSIFFLRRYQIIEKLENVQQTTHNFYFIQLFQPNNFTYNAVICFKKRDIDRSSLIEIVPKVWGLSSALWLPKCG